MTSVRRVMSAAAALSLIAGAGAAYAAMPASTGTGSPQGAGALSQSLPDDVIAASFARGSTWRPGPAVYGTTSTDDIPVTMSDGTILRANVITPTDPKTGKPAAGPFP